MALFYKDFTPLHRIYKGFNKKPYGIDFRWEAVYTESMRAYLADDEEAIRRFLRRWLEKKGWSVETYPSGDALVAACRKKAPDIVISDVDMPGALGGLQACRLLRREAKVRVILMTGNPAHAPAIRKEGFRHILLKPFPLSELEGILLENPGGKGVK